MRTAVGYITGVQEERFRVVTDEGQALLLTLHRSAPLTGEYLCRLFGANVHVTVHFEGEPNTQSAVAHSVVPSPAYSGDWQPESGSSQRGSAARA